MRPFFAILFAILIIAFIYQYTQFTNRIRPKPLQISERQASGTYDVRIVCTFDAEGDVFGIPRRAALSVAFRDRVLLERDEFIAAGQVIEVKDVPDIKVGWNDFSIQVNPKQSGAQASDDAFSLDSPGAADQSAAIARAVRVEIRRSGVVVAEQVIWSSAPGPFGELVRIEVSESVDDDH